MAMTPRQTAGWAALFAGAILVAALGGIGVAWLVYGGRQASPSGTTVASTQPATTRPAGPTTQPALLEPVEGVTLIGKAVCSSCSLNVGPPSEHWVVLVTEQPYRTYLLARNDKLEEIEAITGACAAGDIELTATGDVLIVGKQNVLAVESFTHRALGEDAGG